MKCAGIFQQADLLVIEETKHRRPYLIYQFCCLWAMLDIVGIGLPFNVMQISKAQHYLHICIRNLKGFSIPGNPVPMIYAMNRFLPHFRMSNGELSDFLNILFFHLIVCKGRKNILTMQVF